MEGNEEKKTNDVLIDKEKNTKRKRLLIVRTEVVKVVFLDLVWKARRLSAILV